MSWSPDWNTLSDVGTVAAVIISIAAIFISHRGQSAQVLRQKKEELRGVLEKLFEIREDISLQAKEKDEALKASAMSFLGGKRSIYLEAAELIARSIPEKHITGSEYTVIAFENSTDSDFIDAQKYYELAAKHSMTSSPIKKSEIYRLLAWTYFIKDQTLQNHKKGREAFFLAIKGLENKNDPYSCFTRVLGYRNWAEAEIGIPNREEAWRILSLAYEEWLKIPTSQAVLWVSDLRQIAYDWSYIGASYFQASTECPAYLDKGRSAFREGEKVINTLIDSYGVENDYGIDALGLVFQSWAREEHAVGCLPEGRRLLTRAENEFMRLSNDFPWKGFRLAELKKAQALMAVGQSHVSPLPQPVPGQATASKPEFEGSPSASIAAVPDTSPSSSVSPSPMAPATFAGVIKPEVTT